MSAVHFGKAAGTAIHLDSTSRLEVTSPAHYESTVHVRVETAAGTSAARTQDEYSYRYRPHPVRSLTVSDNTATSVALSWLPSVDDPADWIEIHRLRGRTAPSDPTPSTLIATLTPDATSYRDTGLLPGSGYAYSVFAVSYGGALHSDPASVLAHTSPTVRPAAPQNLMNQGQDAASCADPNAFTRGYADINETAVSARLTNPDVPTAPLRLHIAVLDYGTSGTDPVALIRLGQSAYWSAGVDSGNTAVTRFWGIDLVEGHRYGVYGVSSDGTHNSAPSATCGFWVDSTAPTRPAVTGDFPPDGTPRVGSPATFTFTSSDAVPAAGRYAGIDHFAYSFAGCYELAGDGGTHVTATTDGPDATASITETPTVWGPNSICVQAVDGAGNMSPATTYQFYVVGSPRFTGAGAYRR